jgi:hypothetical protein
VWQLAKALYLRQCITDGGIYTPNMVAYWNPKLRQPGLDTLSRMWDWHAPNRGRKMAPLCERPMEPGVLPEWADVEALRHVKAFWAPYGLDFDFELAHKPENSFLAAAYWSKADYMLETPSGRKHALRGRDPRRQKDGDKPHPSVALLDAILDGSDTFPDDLTYERSGILKIGRYKLAQVGHGYANLRDLMPGDNLPAETYTATFNNVWFPLPDAATFERRAGRRKAHRGQRVEWFEQYRHRGIAYVHMRMRNDNLH